MLNRTAESDHDEFNELAEKLIAFADVLRFPSVRAKLAVCVGLVVDVDVPVIVNADARERLAAGFNEVSGTH